MNCWHCGTEVIWGADFDMEDVNDGEESEYDFFSTLLAQNVSHTLKFFTNLKNNYGFSKRNSQRNW